MNDFNSNNINVNIEQLLCETFLVSSNKKRNKDIEIYIIIPKEWKCLGNVNNNSFINNLSSKNQYLHNLLNQTVISLSLYIKTSTQKTFEKVKETLKILKEQGDKIQIFSLILPNFTEEKGEPKEEYKKDILDFQERNKWIQIKYNQLIKELQCLGVNTEYVGSVPLKDMPKEYYHWNINSNYSSCQFTIYSQTNTQLYQFLSNHRCLEFK